MISSSSILRRYQSNSEYRPRASYRSSNLRYLALFLACMVMIGDAYCFDNPMALQTEIQNTFGIDNLSFNLLYTVYSLPNIVLPFFGGLLIDKIGTRVALVLFSTIVLVGQGVCVLGVYQEQFWLLLLGRVIFGMGSESLNTSQNTIMAQWFKDKDMSLAIGLCISIPKVGSAANTLLSPTVFKKSDSLTLSFAVGMGFLIFSYLCAVALVYMDKQSDKHDNQSRAILENFLKANQDILGKKGSRSMMKSSEKFADPASGSQTFTLPDATAHVEAPALHKSQQMKASGHHEAKEEINFRDLAKLSGSFWIVIIICMISEALFVPFLDNGNDFFQVRFGFTADQAGIFLIIPYLISAIATPLVGFFSDKVGKRGYMIILTSAIFLTTHILLLLLECDSVCIESAVPLFMLGICFAFYASVVIPSVPLVVQPQFIGTAFGLTGVFQNTALALFPMVTGLIFNQFDKNGEDLSNGYVHQSYFFVGMSLFNLIIAVFLQIVDRIGAKSLQGSVDKRTVLVQDSNPNQHGRSRIKQKHLVPEEDGQQNAKRSELEDDDDIDD